LRNACVSYILINHARYTVIPFATPSQPIHVAMTI